MIRSVTGDNFVKYSKDIERVKLQLAASGIEYKSHLSIRNNEMRLPMFCFTFKDHALMIDSALYWVWMPELPGDNIVTKDVNDIISEIKKINEVKKQVYDFQKLRYI